MRTITNSGSALWRQIALRQRALSSPRSLAPAALLVCLALAALAGCGHHAATAKGKGAVPTGTVNRKGLGTPTLSSGAQPPYSFPRQWQTSNAPASVSSFAFMPANPRIGFACADPSLAANTVRLYATHDGGVSWTPVANAPISNPAIQFAGCEVFPDQTNANDVFVSMQDVSAPGDTHGVGRLYRSQDGGATWQKLALVVPNTWYGPNALAVSGARIVVTVAPGGEQNALPNYLYASDDGGQTWRSIAPSLNGKSLLVSAEMSVMGGTVFVTASAYQTGPSSARPTYVQGRHLSAPGSSGTPAPTTYWRSHDGGMSWTQVQLPGDLPMFVPTMTGGYYAVSLKRPRDASGAYIPSARITPYASSDGGASWKALPTFAGVEQGYLDPTLLGMNGGMTICPDGTIVAAALHTSPTSSDDAGFFALRLSDANPTWQPLAASQGATNLQSVVQNGQIRLWGLLYNDPQNGALAAITLN